MRVEQILRDRTEPSAERRPAPPAQQSGAEHQPGLPRNHDGRQFNRPMRQQPSEEKFGLARHHVVRRDGAQDYSIVKKQQARAETGGHAERQGEKRDANVMRHEKSRETGVLTAEPVFLRGLFSRDALAWRLVREIEGKENLPRRRIETQGDRAEACAQHHDSEGKREGPDVPPENLGKSGKKPAAKRGARGALARFVNLTVGAAHQRFEITADLRREGESREPGQIGRSLLVEKMEARELRSNSAGDTDRFRSARGSSRVRAKPRAPAQRTLPRR